MVLVDGAGTPLAQRFLEAGGIQPIILARSSNTQATGSGRPLPAPLSAPLIVERTIARLAGSATFAG
jgi:hypothetical protein